MKKRLLQALLLLVIMALLNAPSLAPMEGQGEIIKTDVAAQPETTIYKRNDKLIINKKETRTIYNSIQFKSATLFRLILTDKKERELNNLILKMEEEIKAIETVEDKEEFFIEYKNIIEKYAEVITLSNTIYDEFSKEELTLLFGVVQAEIGNGYSFEQKCNVVSVIFNRMAHDRFPNELKEVLTPDQFETISNGTYKMYDISETTILACEYVYIFGATNEALYFHSNKKEDSFCGADYMFSDGSGHSFYGYKN